MATKKQLLREIIKARKRNGMTVYAAGKAGRVGSGAWCQIESGKRPASWESLFSMAEAVGVKIDITMEGAAR